jgi:hypothetical protein
VNNIILDELSNEVHVNINMLGRLMLNMVVRDVYVALIITPNVSGMLL